MSMHENTVFDLDAMSRAREESDRRAKQETETAREEIRWLLGGKRGRKFMYRMLARAGVWNSVFSTDAIAMAFNEGRRNEGLYLVNQIMKSAPEKWALMIEENKNDGSNSSTGN